MTLDEFRATGRDVPNLGTIDHIAASGIESGAGRVYQDDLFMMRTDAGWCVPIGNTQAEFVALADAESKLYEFAVSEGYINE